LASLRCWSWTASIMRRFSPSRDDRSERAKNNAAEISRKIVAGQPY
jgi:hypothetical protein